MGIVEDEEKKVALWVIKEEVPIALQAGASALVGFLSSAKISPILASLGITIDPKRFVSTVVVLGTAFITTAITHLATSWAKNKMTTTAQAVTNVTGGTK